MSVRAAGLVAWLIAAVAPAIADENSRSTPIASGQKPPVSNPQSDYDRTKASAKEGKPKTSDEPGPPTGLVVDHPVGSFSDKIAPSPDADDEAARQEERAEADLKAQQDMAKWACAMFAATSVQIFLSAIGIVFVWLSLKLNRDAVNVAMKGANTASIANDLTKAAMANDQRPWVTVGAEIVGNLSQQETPIYIPITARLKNIGKTPAKDVVTHYQVLMEPSFRYIADAVNNMVENMRQSRLSEVRDIAISLLPNESHVDRVCPHIDRDRISLIQGGETPVVFICVIFCVQYGTTLSDDIYTTAAGYQLCWIDNGREGDAIPWDGRLIAQKVIRTYRRPGGLVT